MEGNRNRICSEEDDEEEVKSNNNKLLRVFQARNYSESKKMSIPKEPEEVMKLRGGSVLGKKTILKSDHFPGCQNKRLRPNIDGAPNYRQVFLSFISTTQILSLL